MGSFDIFIDDAVGKPADVQVKWYVIVAPMGIRQRRIYTFPLRDKIKHSEVFGGTWQLTVDTDPQLEQIRKSNGGNMAIAHRQFFVASGGPEWDEDISNIDDLEYFLDETTSNVEEGLGYVSASIPNGFRWQHALLLTAPTLRPVRLKSRFGETKKIIR